MTEQSLSPDPLILHNDEPTLRDRLDRHDMMRQVGSLIASCDPPQVFGVHGDWGSGKTTFLHLLQYYLTGECRQLGAKKDVEGAAGFQGGIHERAVSVVWFEAWRYQHETAPVVALLHEIRSQLPWTSRFLNNAKKIGEVAARSALLSLEDLTKKIGIQASKIQATGEKWEKENLAVALPSHVIRQHLEIALKQILYTPKGSKASPPRLVVMIDDLDRCSPDSAYALLEGIKIYLNLPSCVFVLGMNQQIVEDAIARNLPRPPDGEKDLSGLRAREYLEKLCQNIVHLHLPGDPASLLDHYLDGFEASEKICVIVRKFRCLPANPRKIKAFANLLRRNGDSLARIIQASEDHERTARLAVILYCLYHFHPEIYRIVEAHPGFFAKVARWAKGFEVDHPAFETVQRVRDRGPLGDQEAPEGEPELFDAFPDPGDGSILRVQDLIRTVEEVTHDEIKNLLLR